MMQDILEGVFLISGMVTAVILLLLAGLGIEKVISLFLD
jgi:hypothetical protein